MPIRGMLFLNHLSLIPRSILAPISPRDHRVINLNY